MRKLDHVALRVAHRDEVAAQLLELLDVVVIDQTDKFTLIGPEFGQGKITLFDSEEGTETRPIRLVSLVFAEHESNAGAAPIVLKCGLVLTFQTIPDNHETLARHSLIGVMLRGDNPQQIGEELVSNMRMTQSAGNEEVVSLMVGSRIDEGTITITKEAYVDIDHAPMLDHIGVLVKDASMERERLKQLGYDIERWVEAENTDAVFVYNNEHVLIEFVEHLTANKKRDRLNHV